MAPSYVMSRIRGNHRRTNSSDTSPQLPRTNSSDGPLQTSESLHPFQFQDDESSHSNSPISPVPPVLPPIPRVASRYESRGTEHSRYGRKAENMSTVSEAAAPKQQENFTADKSTLYHQEEISYNKITAPQDQPIHFHLSETSPISNPSPERPATSASNSTVLNPQGTSHDFHFSQSKQHSAPQKAQQGQYRSAKTRLNLLNPMSLLLRRRSSQAATYLPDSNGKVSTVPGMPDDFDPRIRGIGVHDFNAPRPKRNVSSNDLETLSRNVRLGGHGPRNGDKEYTPAFTEQFGESGIMETAEKGEPNDGISSQPHDSKLLPPFARRLPPIPDELRRVRSEFSLTSESAIIPPRLDEEIQSQQAPTSPKSQKTRSRGPSLSDESFQPIGLPRHMSSNASRFSFDLAGLGSSAQEKLLEEKHREKTQARKSTQSVDVPDDDSIDEEEMYDMENFDDDGGFEEKIPGVNADDEEDTVVDPGSHVNATGFDFQLQQTGLASPESSTDASTFMNTPRDLAGNIIGFAATKESPISNQTYRTSQLQTPLTPDSLPGSQPHIAGLGLTGMSDFSSVKPLRSSISPPISRNDSDMPQDANIDSDELYFDDGMIDVEPQTQITAFDESWFDDGADNLPANPSIMSAKVYSQSLQQSTTALNHQSKEVNPGTIPTDLAEYHGALAHAANLAAADGKFNRRDSIDEGPVEPQNLLPEQKETHLMDDESSNFANFDDNTYDLDDDLEDDPIIAAANAEALANDEDGFYGQEFGFYAQSNTVRDADYVNGGYFYNEGLMRSQSGKVASREPNLTPITERSESSNRNSTTSLQSHLMSQFQNASPALFQLQSLAGDFADDDISLGALMRLRRGAFGGSNSSLRSAASGASPAGGSPLSHFSARQSSSNLLSNDVSQHPIGNSNVSLGNSNGTLSSNSPGSEFESPPASPTIMLNTKGRLSLAIDKNTVNSSSDSSPIKRTEPQIKRHRKTGSGADSISYSREESEDGGERWVLEKRRMSSSGEMELVGREFVGAGRI